MDDSFYGAVASCSVVLGSLYLRDPRDDGACQAAALAEALGRGEWPLGGERELRDASQLVREGAVAPLDALGREYKRLFVGPGHFEAPAWGSVYLDPDEIVFGNSNLELCQWMRRNGIEIREGEGGREPADHIGKMLVLLGWLAENKPDIIPEYLSDHLMPWVPRYLELLGEASPGTLYCGLAKLTAATLDGVTSELGVSASEKRLYH